MAREERTYSDWRTDSHARAGVEVNRQQISGLRDEIQGLRAALATVHHKAELDDESYQILHGGLQRTASRVTDLEREAKRPSVDDDTLRAMCELRDQIRLLTRAIVALANQPCMKSSQLKAPAERKCICGEKVAIQLYEFYTGRESWQCPIHGRITFDRTP